MDFRGCLFVWTISLSINSDWVLTKNHLENSSNACVNSEGNNRQNTTTSMTRTRAYFGAKILFHIFMNDVFLRKIISQ